MKDFTIGAVIDVFEEGVVICRQNNIYTEQVLEDFIRHCYLVAYAAEVISSKIPQMDTEAAYSLGLLHDYGKFLEVENADSFHGVVGYWAMKRKGWDLAANICLSHSFLQKNFSQNEYYTYGEKNLKNAKELLRGIDITDYDKLIQLSDMVVNVYEHSTIKQRMEFIKKKYKLKAKDIKNKYNQAMKLKEYFDKKCGCNIYDLLGIND